MSLNCVVTGTSRGIGLELIRQLLQDGNRVFALARSPNQSQGLLSLKKEKGDRLSVFAVDVNSDRDVAAFISDLGSTHNIDLLINNAGIYGGDNSFEKLSFEEVLKTIATNALGPMRMTRALLPHLRRSNSPRVIHITSLMGSISDNESGGSYGYRMSKAALNMFHKSFSKDYPEITSIVMHPGWVKTDMGGSQAPTSVHDSAKGILNVLKKIGPKDSGKFLDYEGSELPW